MLKEEILAAIQEIKKGKAVGVDDIPVEFLKLMNEDNMEKVVDLCKLIYETGVWPKDFTRAILFQYQRRQTHWNVLTTEPSNITCVKNTAKDIN